MSIRSIVEINHDFLYNWQNQPEEAGKLLYAILCGVQRVPAHTQHVFGITVLAQRHHSTKIQVTCE